ncbi:hypothetical protein [Neobacillus soli]|uniref:hypothetical protein n=1 Tax=Neobacillus soli TaxID=220688 RepID=UPI0008258BC0|nr:hypothetical protein [Neobacillus soli]
MALLKKLNSFVSMSKGNEVKDMDSFKTVRDRDAWATIRGYVYQVDLTIDRWIDLKDNDLLELERGEDVDIVSEAITSTGAQRNRILEQIKHRDKNITLRSSEAIEAMVSFYDHLQYNTGKKLVFRFITNAKISTERPALFHDKVAGISVWEKLRTGTEKENKITERLKNIREFLKLTSRPSAIGVTLWNNWIKFIKKSNDEVLMKFIKNFEWSSSNTPFQRLEEKIQKKLVDLHIVTNLEEGGKLYRKLFLHVFKKLSQPGIKKLSKEELFAQKEMNFIDKNDIQLLNNLHEIWKILDLRVHDLENKVQFHVEQFSKFDDEIEKLKTEVGFQATIDRSVQRPELNVPILDNVIPRSESVKLFVEKLQQHTWCAIYGNLGSGKTNLAMLIANEVEECIAWIRLRDLNPKQAALRIDDILVALSGKTPKSDWNDWYKDVSATLPRNSLIILDDVPRLNGASPLDEHLKILVRAFHEKGLKVLSTSAYPLPITLIQDVPNGIIGNHEVPNFTIDEIKNMLILYGAPQILVDNEKFIGLLIALTERHPVLLTAATRYLQERRWSLDNDNLQALFQGEYRQGLNDLIQNELINKLEDESTRELLYRLTLVKGSFSMHEVQEISQISPIIGAPFEKINKAKGLWIQNDTATTYLVSPLLYTIGPLNLQAETKKNTHFILGKGIIQKRYIHPIEGAKAIHHFVSAEAYKEAAMTLISSLDQLEVNKAYSDEWGFSLMWYSAPLPEQMDLHSKMLLRTKQIMVLIKMEKDVNHLIKELEEMIEQIGNTDSTAKFISLYLANYYVDKDPLKATKFLIKGLSGFYQPNSQSENDLGELSVHPVTIIWIAGVLLKSSHDIIDWLEMISSIPGRLLEVASKSEIAPECCMKICDQIWLDELNKGENDREWNQVINVLEKVKHVSNELGLTLLWACAVRAQIIVLAEYKDDLKAATLLAEESIKFYPNEPVVRFLIQGILGKQFVFKSRYSDAITNLTEALKSEITEYPTERIFCYIELSKAFGDGSPQHAIFFTQHALEISKQNNINQDELMVKALGEHMVALWMAGEINRIYPYYEEMVLRLLEADKNKDAWKILFVAFGHVSGFLSSMIATGKPPAGIRGGEEYAAPTRGFFIVHHPLLVNIYDPSNDWFLAAHLSMAAEALGFIDEAEKWIVKSFDIALERGNIRGISLLGTQAIDYLIRINNFSLSLDIAIETETMFELRNRGKEYDANAELVIGLRSDMAWAMIEERAAELAVIPAVLTLLKAKYNSSSEVTELSEQLISTCKQMQIISPIPKFWNSLAETIGTIFSEDLTFNQFINLSKFHNQRSLQFLCYIGATLVALPADALKIYKAFEQFIEGRYIGLGKLYNNNILPFILEYWTTQLNKNSFLFSHQDYIQTRLNDCRKVPQNQQLSQILKVIEFGLKIH